MTGYPIGWRAVNIYGIYGGIWGTATVTFVPSWRFLAGILPDVAW